jgi:hypothetical protein
MSPLTACLAVVLAFQGGTGAAAPGADAPPPVPPLPQLVVQWVYPRATASRLVERTILPREQDILRMHTADAVEQVEAFYRKQLNDDSGSYSVVSAVNQRIVANVNTVVTIEAVGPTTVITVVARQPELEQTPASPFPVKKGGVRPPPS